jgi:NAD-dependent deacetylase
VLVKVQSRPYEAFTLVTRNIGGLHSRAGSLDVTELHGSMHRAR